MPHTFACEHWHQDRIKCWNKDPEHPEWATDFAGVCDAAKCSCDAVENLAVGQEYPKFGKPAMPSGYPTVCQNDFYPIPKMKNGNAKSKYASVDLDFADCCARCAHDNDVKKDACMSYTFFATDPAAPYGTGTCELHGYTRSSDLVADATATSGWFSGDSLQNYIETESMTLSNIMNGSWFSTQKAGECGPGQVLGKDCWWSLVNQTANVNATCVNDRMIDAVVATRGGDCFEDCADPKDQNDACWIKCFFETIVGNTTSKLQPTNRSLILDAFTNAFDPAAGCPTVPPCGDPCHPPCWAVPKGDPCAP